MASVYRPTRRLKDGSRVRCRNYRVAYKASPTVRRTVKAFRDKQASLALGRQLERAAERAMAGLPVVQTARLRAPIALVLDAYVADLVRRGTGKDHQVNTRNWLDVLVAHMSWKSLEDFRADGLTRFLADVAAGKVAQGGTSARTLNGYRGAAVRLCNWAQLQGWLLENPLAQVPSAKVRRVRRRRALTIDEFRRLLDATRPKYQLGWNRRDAYEVAGLTGFRRSDLLRLERGAVLLGATPAVRFRPDSQKAGRYDLVPLLPEAAATLARLLDRQGQPTDRVFPKLPAIETYRIDLEAAGVPYVDAEGRVADFHALRYFFCTLVARHLPIQTVRILMRHANIRETCDVYMDLGLVDAAEGIARLPPILALQPALTGQPPPDPK